MGVYRRTISTPPPLLTQNPTYQRQPYLANRRRICVYDLATLHGILGRHMSTLQREQAANRKSYGDVLQLPDALTERRRARVKSEAWNRGHLFAQGLEHARQQTAPARESNAGNVHLTGWPVRWRYRSSRRAAWEAQSSEPSVKGNASHRAYRRKPNAPVLMARSFTGIVRWSSMRGT